MIELLPLSQMKGKERTWLKINKIFPPQQVYFSEFSREKQNHWDLCIYLHRQKEIDFKGLAPVMCRLANPKSTSQVDRLETHEELMLQFQSEGSREADIFLSQGPQSFSLKAFN